MPSDPDTFDDVLQQNNGIFAAGLGATGDGYEDYTTAKTEATPQGVFVEMRCRHCGATRRIEIEYPEMIAIANDVAPQFAYGAGYGQLVKSPTPWAWSNVTSAWWPQVACSSCQTPVGPMFKQREAHGHVQEAVNRKWIDGTQANRLSTHCHAAAQRQPPR